MWTEVGDQAAVFNGMTGAFTVMSVTDRDQVQAFVEDEGSGEGIETLLTDLVGRWVIVNDHADELAELRRGYDDSRWRSDTLGLTVVTGLGCNFDCPYCFEDKKPSLVKPAVADALVGILEDSRPSIGRVSVTWMGSEPLLGTEQLLALSERLMRICTTSDIGYSASIITNGWYPDGPTAQVLAAARVNSAQVTIDGPPDVHDAHRPHLNGGSTFERIVTNIGEAADHLDVHVRINVDTTNAHRVEELLAILAERGLARRVAVGLGRITDAVSNEAAPLASHSSSCLSAPQFVEFELAFNEVARSYGFLEVSPPVRSRPRARQCTPGRSWSAPTARCGRAGTTSAHPIRRSARSSTTPSPTITSTSGSSSTPPTIPSAPPASPCRSAWAAAPTITSTPGTPRRAAGHSDTTMSAG